MSSGSSPLIRSPFSGSSLPIKFFLNSSLLKLRPSELQPQLTFPIFDPVSSCCHQDRVDRGASHLHLLDHLQNGPPGMVFRLQNQVGNKESRDHRDRYSVSEQRGEEGPHEVPRGRANRCVCVCVERGTAA